MITGADKDVTGVFDEQFNQLFVSARPMKAEVLEDATPMTHPLETGASVTDHVIINPTAINLTMLLTGVEFKSIYEQIKTAFKKSTLLIVQTRMGSYQNMVITGIPHEETSDMVDVTLLNLKLEEVKFFKMTYSAGAMKKSSNKPTVKSGEKAPVKKQQSVAYKIFN